MGLTPLGAEALKAGINFGLSSIGNVGSGLFSINQARKNRAFQERMYKQSVADAERFWRMENEYALPSAELQRIKDAGLNPLLYYQNGGASSATGNLTLPSSPSGSKADTPNFNTRIDMANLALIEAQVKNINADTEQKAANAEDTKAHADWQKTEAQFNREVYSLRLAIERGNLEQTNTIIENLRTMMMNSTRLTTQQVLSYQQSRMMEIKRFEFDKETMGERLKQMWQDVKSGRIQANASMRNAAAAWLNATTNANLSKFQIGLMAQEFLFNKAANPLKLKGLSLENTLKKWDTHLKKATLDEKQTNIVNQNLRNYYLNTFGSEEIYKSQIGGTIRDIAGPFINLGNALFSW